MDNSAVVGAQEMAGGIDRLSLVTFNAGLLQFKLLGVSWYKNPPFTNRRLRKIPLALRGCDGDVLCLQEVYDNRHACYITDSLGWVYPYSGRCTSGGVLALHNGLLTLSKFPVLDSAFYPFHRITLAESVFGSKGILACTIAVPNLGTLRVLNVHMVSGTVDPESRSLDDIRLQEMIQIVALAQQASLLGHIPLIVGDFNAGPSVCPSSYEHLIEQGWQDAFAAARRPPTYQLPHLTTSATSFEIGPSAPPLREDPDHSPIPPCSEAGFSTPSLGFMKRNLSTHTHTRSG
ncbi:endonuclease/exonuclease/phosphatase domain protein [Gregarina niphandrodes]|uniref:Endonuclease/exonuclease/phosphatase domain protein n=1 Tax=Gregarina niphandrodes TaxID=110365 RepID=A0A023B5Q1_GRENI|nr:endonuclease/exonuclease/phosphatase domain protein [Gregarina niphandrodes]EZG62259.1 endonuclease/exonuclease/phosphatase domain protein [Gregarina niphandrodes]|eukprot:XP_011130731.1 endonuclease/exonuclease/phosphatase domain protein [Gregarina niphandrodes]